MSSAFFFFAKKNQVFLDRAREEHVWAGRLRFISPCLNFEPCNIVADCIQDCIQVIHDYCTGFCIALCKIIALCFVSWFYTSTWEVVYRSWRLKPNNARARIIRFGGEVARFANRNITIDRIMSVTSCVMPKPAGAPTCVTS